jgi:hypothetical protein
MRYSVIVFLAVICFFPLACSNDLASQEQQSKAVGFYRGKISFSQGSQYIALELRETGHYTLNYTSILDSTDTTKETGVYVLRKEGTINLARRSMYLRNFKLSQNDKLLVLNASSKPYTNYADSSFYLEKISSLKSISK